MTIVRSLCTVTIKFVLCITHIILSLSCDLHVTIVINSATKRKPCQIHQVMILILLKYFSVAYGSHFISRPFVETKYLCIWSLLRTSPQSLCTYVLYSQQDCNRHHMWIYSDIQMQTKSSYRLSTGKEQLWRWHKSMFFMDTLCPPHQKCNFWIATQNRPRS